ncbi:PspC domain-containing protein [Marinilactibacillus sp. Marseille-P9653]|uniref:PspC domain-containing protein n=1 Tax=Marinilactibacillus sp. Marseille-P9653 TaxID=2866583 RepID=UPI001CE3C191|nr:PspC domain-containing protein [Marinilactibacillus sp. Marseille-P9653]
MGNLRKSKENSVIFGVLGGIGEYFNVDPVLLRVIVVVATFAGVGLTVPLYLFAALLMPDGKSSKKSGTYHTFNDRPNPFSGAKPSQRKEAEKVDEDDWSDF